MKLKKILSSLLIISIITLTLYIDQKEVEAIALPAVPVMVVVGLTLVAAGVIASNDKSMQYAVEKAWDSFDTATKNAYTDAVNSNLGYMVLNDLTWDNVKDYVSGTYQPGNQKITGESIFENVVHGKLYKSIGPYSLSVTYYPGTGYWYVSITGHPATGPGFETQAQAQNALNKSSLVLLGNSLSVYYNDRSWSGISVDQSTIGKGELPAEEHDFVNELIVSNPGDWVNTGTGVLAARDRRIFVNPNLVAATSFAAAYAQHIAGKTSAMIRNDANAYPSQNIYQPGSNPFELPEFVAPVTIIPTVTTPVTVEGSDSISVDFPEYTGSNEILQGVSAFVSAVVAALLGGFNTSISWMDDIWNVISVGFTNIGDWLQDVISSISAFFPNVIANIIAGYTAMVDGLSDIWDTVSGGFDAVTNYLNLTLDKIRLGFADLVGLLGAVIAYLVDFTTFLNPLSDGFILKVAFVPEDGFFQTEFDEVKDAFMLKMPTLPVLPEFQDRDINWSVTIGGSILPRTTFDVISSDVLDAYRDEIKSWAGAIMIFMTGLWLLRKLPELVEV